MESNQTNDADFMMNMDDDDMPLDALPSSPIVKAVERKQFAVKTEDDDDDDMMEVSQAQGIVTMTVNMSGTRPVPKIKKTKPYPSPESSSPVRAAEDRVDASSWSDVTQKLNLMNGSQASETSSFGKLDYNDAMEEDGSLRMFWTDYTEVNGSLCLFGKVQNKKTGGYVSCFVKVDNILRKLFFLPREYRQKNKRDTTDEVDMKDVYEEVDGMMERMRVGLHKIKPCTRKYAFELADVPKETEYLKLFYPYSKPQLQPEQLAGSTYSRVFGHNTPLFEQFVLWKNVMGPCWLRIEDAEFGVLNNASHCKLEVQVSNPRTIAPMSDSDNQDDPPLTLMSIAMRTILNVKDNKQEILAISALIYPGISLTDTTSPEKLPCKSFTIMRPVGSSFPIGFDTEVKRRAKGQVKLVKQEQEILSFFLAQLNLADPDVLVGHQLEGVDFSILLSRLQAKKTSQWSRIGRMRRSAWPGSMGKMGENFFAERSLLSGRLLCDLANDCGKSAMTKCTSWSLTEMCGIYLPGTTRLEVDNEAALKTWATSNKGLMDYISHCEADTFYIAALALKVQLLPLTKVLTNLAGNSWARTLTGTRAERNEYILLHEFHRNKYICPDKAVFKGRQQIEEENAEEGDATDVKKKDKYKGGLVFEPEKGLYDKFVLVMDFNSLYPSIIQEFNICFTTVDRTKLSDDEEQVPEVPQDQDLGILPRLIATLVSRRRQVKSLMKGKNPTTEQLATWDIKQLALKLTANSMYGCLGYTKSRFYARPLAVLTTYKGREILRSTKDLAESNSLQVIYGDTDSVMINANVDNVEDAMKVGNEFKRAVNDRYRLLEIDIDNVFRRILLQAKKKYAAINLVQIDGKFVDKMEVKGLDMKRREYCNLSKEVSSQLLNEILSGDESDVVIERIHEYLRDISAKMRENAIPTRKYTIYTKLGKAPKDYPNADSMPQVQVALREMSRGKTVRKDDVMAYIVTGDGKSSSEPPAKRSYTPSDVTKAESGLTPDVEWYLYKQIFPPVERLCANISGTDTVRLADCLGLDVRKYSITNNSNGENDTEIHSLESQIDDAVRFIDASRLELRCGACKRNFDFEGLVESAELCSQSGITCRCGQTLSNISVVAQLEHEIRKQTSKYYEGWLVCNDQACGNRTRQMSVYGHRCLGPRGLSQGCYGKMRYEYTEKMMYNQLLYFSSLFDVDKAKNAAKGTEKERIMALAEHNRVRFGTLRSVVDKYLDKCGRQWVAMDELFRKIGLAV
ncbi:hypothetical protein BJ875DRAFT_448380 [Amylocarpus encephaloides]|uniref:DNA polymerase n=1 Tax=Amylocarpus encephaloides TaxID=45428 RepID=A0A9P8C9Y8_9HELO|nr:hypothetical protein BJ875DRAFT_448380 [Amylocarpus encephaloides]